jgi:hypothetical protein
MHSAPPLFAKDRILLAVSPFCISVRASNHVSSEIQTHDPKTAPRDGTVITEPNIAWRWLFCWVFAPCRLIEIYPRFRGVCCFQCRAWSP